jgi:hypothetical protein
MRLKIEDSIGITSTTRKVSMTVLSTSSPTLILPVSNGSTGPTYRAPDWSSSWKKYSVRIPTTWDHFTSMVPDASVLIVSFPRSSFLISHIM